MHLRVRYLLNIHFQPHAVMPRRADVSRTSPQPTLSTSRVGSGLPRRPWSELDHLVSIFIFLIYYHVDTTLQDDIDAFPKCSAHSIRIPKRSLCPKHNLFVFLSNHSSRSSSESVADYQFRPCSLDSSNRALLSCFSFCWLVY